MGCIAHPLNHDLGNEVLSRQQLLEVVPVFVAVLVWLTRILFIGAFTVAGNWMFDFANLRRAQTKRQARQITSRPALAQGQPRRASLPRPTPLPAGLRPVREPDHVPAIFRRLRREEPAVVGAAGMTADERRSQRLSRPEPVPAVFSAAGEDE